MSKAPSVKPRPVRWIGSSKEDLSAFPTEVKGRVETPKPEIDLIKARLIRAREDYAQWQKSQTSK